MAVVSDANILSSLAAADALDLLPKLLNNEPIYLPPSVVVELNHALQHGKSHVERIFHLIQSDALQILNLIEEELTFALALPHKLHQGERDSIALCKMRGHLLLCNDNRAVRYCQMNGIDVINLEAFLHLIWVRRIITQNEVRTLIEKMERTENLVLTQAQRAAIFAPRRRK